MPAILRSMMLVAVVFVLADPLQARSTVKVFSPDGRNVIVLSEPNADSDVPTFEVRRDGRSIIRPSGIEPVLADRLLAVGSRIVGLHEGVFNDRFHFPWGKNSDVIDRCAYASVTLKTSSGTTWTVELRAYDDGVAFRYRVPKQEGMQQLQLLDDATRFDVAGEPTVMFNTLASFKSSHESTYSQRPISAVPEQTLIDMPMLLHWPDGYAAAITEARVRTFAGAYLERPSDDDTELRLRLAPSVSHEDRCVVGTLPQVSPWRVVLLADAAGKLLESNLLLCLNDPPSDNFDWLQPGKTTWHWWCGAFEEDHKLPRDSSVSLDRHRAYIDFCARNKIAYHAVSGDGYAWYQQSKTGYGEPAADADLLKPRAEIELPKIIQYARGKGVGIRLWVHWKPLSRQLEEAFALYESWGIKGLMVDFLNRDDQEMAAFIERMLRCAARHKLHIQLHGCAKYSGEQRTFPHLFNREGVLNLEYLKWSDLCTPDHNVNVAYTRAISGPVDYHLGGFRSVSRSAFQPRDRAPVVMGTRGHHLALYVIYENPMPMVADSPEAYEGQVGFDFITQVPTTWDETRFLAGEPGEFIVLARRKRDNWYVGGITNWTPRQLHIPLASLGGDKYHAKIYRDGSMEDSDPNAIRIDELSVNTQSHLHIPLAPGGGFAVVLSAVP